MTGPYPLWLDETTCVSALPPDIVHGTVVVTGNFDGIHRGHQALFARALTEADARQLVAVALTFDPHPRTVLGNTPPLRLTSTARRVQLIQRLGVSHVLIRRFDRTFATWEPERFVETLLVGTLHARVVIAGDNFRFGAARAGDDALLRRLGPRLGFEAFTLEAADERGPISSSRVREALVVGDVGEASRLLGRPHSIAGVVETGDQRGRTLGFPTANLGSVGELTPPDGVYAVAVDRIDGDNLVALATGVMNIGVRPTITGNARRTLEVHLFDFDRDLYGQSLRVHFISRLRGERAFDGLEALRTRNLPRRRRGPRRDLFDATACRSGLVRVGFRWCSGLLGA